jgi:glyceraldehyde 3-phosphate dehydrogenase
MAVRVGINGFGRIGRLALRAAMEARRNDIEFVAVNDLGPVKTNAHLLKYDSVHGTYPGSVSAGDGSMTIDGKTVKVLSERDPKKLPWGDLGVDVVWECTGIFSDRDKAAVHLETGAPKVLVSAPSKGADATVVYGVNHNVLTADHKVVSNASCTTNCLAPVAKVLQDSFGIEHLMMSTIHAYTSSQSLMDQPTRKRRRGRAAALSIVPTTTGAAKATALVIPELEGRVDGMAFRVPVENGSVVDLTATLQRDVTRDEVHGALQEAAAGRMRGVLRVTDEALVSRDIIGDPHSSIVDSESTMILGGNVVKIVSWYDNEWGYSARLVDMAAHVS